jgi:hypothetical protein
MAELVSGTNHAVSHWQLQPWEETDMKDTNEEKGSALKEASGGLGMVLLVSAAILVIAVLFYLGLGGFDAPAP